MNTVSIIDMVTTVVLSHNFVISNTAQWYMSRVHDQEYATPI